MSLVHATVVSLNGRGIMITGPSGSGKSDLALRLIEEAGARLVGDDYVTLAAEQDRLWARPAENISGLLEVRGVGLVKMEFLPSTALDLVLVLPAPASAAKPERLPDDRYFTHEDISVRQLDFLPFEASAVAKIKAIVRHFLT